MEMKFNNANYPQKQIAEELGCSGSTIKRYKNDKNWNSPNKRNNNKKSPQTSLQSSSNMKEGVSAKNENGEINEKYLGGTLENK